MFSNFYFLYLSSRKERKEREGERGRRPMSSSICRSFSCCLFEGDSSSSGNNQRSIITTRRITSEDCGIGRSQKEWKGVSGNFIQLKSRYVMRWMIFRVSFDSFYSTFGSLMDIEIRRFVSLRNGRRNKLRRNWPERRRNWWIWKKASKRLEESLIHSGILWIFFYFCLFLCICRFIVYLYSYL